MRPQYHFRKVDGQLYAWDVRKLITFDGPVMDLPIASIQEVDEPYWYGPEGNPATCRDILTHARLISDADLQYPILICSDHRIIDGMHRVLKAINQDRATIKARQIRLPAPDYIDRKADRLPYD